MQNFNCNSACYLAKRFRSTYIISEWESFRRGLTNRKTEILITHNRASVTKFHLHISERVFFIVALLNVVAPLQWISLVKYAKCVQNTWLKYLSTRAWTRNEKRNGKSPAANVGIWNYQHVACKRLPNFQTIEFISPLVRSLNFYVPISSSFRRVKLWIF